MIEGDMAETRLEHLAPQKEPTKRDGLSTTRVILNRAIAWRCLTYLAAILAVPSIVNTGLMRDRVAHPLANVIALVASSTLEALGAPVDRYGTVLVSRFQRLDVTIECTGVDVFLFVAAAMALFPCPPRIKAIGISLALIVTTGINVIRILTLCLIRSGQAFETAHTMFYPFAVIAAGMAVFILWVERFALRRARDH